jgi:polar amino acid transport system substrate-binding protein
MHRLLPLLLSFGLTVAGATTEAPPAIVFQSTDTPPFWSPKLPNNGVGGAILQLLSANAGIPYAINYLPVARFRQSKAPYIVGDPDILLDKKPRAILPMALFNSAFFFYQPQGAVAPLRSLRDLQGHTLGVLRGTLEENDYFIAHGVKVEESDSLESLLRKLKRGRIDACIMVSAAGWHLIRQMFPADQHQFTDTVIPGSERPIALLIDISQPEGRAVAQRYRQVLHKTLHSATYRDIVKNASGESHIPSGRDKHLQRLEHDYADDGVP